MEKYKRNLDAIDHTQNRYDDHNKIHIHPYDPQVLELVREDFLLPRTCKEFIEVLISRSLPDRPILPVVAVSDMLLPMTSSPGELDM